ncbi:ATP synthase F1 subunit delta [Candidatus Schneideria nysicola]|uniref:ATP synthase F1 subunit delta n=1 Tax=Candidatus Schneideria nysicola TaxID=1081631 RepID=UPI001CAA6DC1|nr:ATP synthase F1 subunit delta [Candidatus Schneideria nysicola]UAJ66273.1 ATP synthase F1 subunit delta [Candidatus Schneideria nysicola]
MKYMVVAHQYAQASFDFALLENKIEHWQSMLEFASQLIHHNRLIKKLICNPIISSDDIASIFIEISDKKLDCFFQNFIRIMAKNKRLQILPNVLERFIYLRSIRELIINIDIISTIRLSTDQIKKIANVMTKYFPKYKIKFNIKIDTSILGGILLLIGENIVIDGSIRYRMERLTAALLKK